MTDLRFVIQPIAAAGYSLLSIIFGGGLGGAIDVSFLAKHLCK